MKIRFTVLCHTTWGQQVHIVGSAQELGGWDPDCAARMSYSAGDLWNAEISMERRNVSFEYRYIMKDESGNVLYEEIAARQAPEPDFLLRSEPLLHCIDEWRSPSDPDSVFLTAPFASTVFQRDAGNDSSLHRSMPASGSSVFTVRLQLTNRRINGSDSMYVTGSIPALGEWDPEKARPMHDRHFPRWALDIPFDGGDAAFSYRYMIKDKANTIIVLEEEDRFFAGISTAEAEGAAHSGGVTVVTDNSFAFTNRWKGAGIALPVFSIRSKKGLGIGEFLDLKELADWARSAGFQAIQTLPVNDTSAVRDGGDFCPYSCISVFALHPIYLNLEAVGDLSDDVLEEINTHRERLNKQIVVNHREIMSVKLSLLEKIFVVKKGSFLSSSDFHVFLQKHGHWVKPYAAFCALRDHYGTSDFQAWVGHERGTKEEISRITDSGSPYYDTVAFYYFIQYHLHAQLSEAARYASEKGIILKGDIPIGIQKASCSCWTDPGLFHMDQSTGAPPDPFSDTGQNWGFPTYNWDEMARDNYSWWRRRMRHMTHYFQMIRLDHVLGFFRIWEIPDSAVSALLGHFSPALPITRSELEEHGIWDFNRLCEPFITESRVRDLFGDDAEIVVAMYLNEYGERFCLKPGFATQRQVERHFSSRAAPSGISPERRERLKSGLCTLIADIILFGDPLGYEFHPRINALSTASFIALEDWEKEILTRLYYDYFYRRQEDFWRQRAMIRLPVLKKASNMLICGEDLGMIPDCVPDVMEELCLLGLRIQRMPKEPGREFGLPGEYHYLTICSTSSHDMSSLRGWWEEDPERTSRYWRTILACDEEPPATCEPFVCKKIIAQHLESPSMWAIFPIQDITAMNETLRRPARPREEQINNPADPFNQWGFRMYFSLEELKGETEFNEMLRGMIHDSGRNGPY